MNEYEAETLKRRFEEQLQICQTFWLALANHGSVPRSSRPVTVRRSASGKSTNTLGTEKKGEKTLDKISSKVLEVKNNTDPNIELAL